MFNLGGNLLYTIQSPLKSVVQFANQPYIYKFLEIKKNVHYALEGLSSACFFMLTGTIEYEDLKLCTAGDSLQIENKIVQLTGLADSSTLLLVGSSQSQSAKEKVSLLSLNQLKKVQKPWGYEIWITGEHPGYCLKKIFIKKGTKTSLQYHKIKRETNVLFEGTARLYYKIKPEVNNDLVCNDDLAFYEMNPISIIDIYPETVHRLEAISDILLYEVSTPHLDDIIRISDDTNRLSGRINSEHGKNES